MTGPARRFAESVVLVTGAASGIGEWTSVRLAEEGAKVVGIDLNDGRWVSYQGDLVDPSFVERVVAEVVQQYRRIDVLANIAGIGSVGDTVEAGISEWMRVLSVNIGGVISASAAVLPCMRERRRGSIVNVSSITALVGNQRRAVYSASKGAVLALTRAMAADHAAEGIRVNAVCPGPTDTPWVRRRLANEPDREGALRSLERRVPLGRLIKPAEVAAAIAYLASDEAAAITGAYLVVDGGASSLRGAFSTPTVKA